jgi:hypothetical protein
MKQHRTSVKPGQFAPAGLRFKDLIENRKGNKHDSDILTAGMVMFNFKDDG